MAALLSPLPVIALAVIAGWAWWVALVPVVGVIALVAEVAGIRIGVLTALVATAGLVLVIDRDDGATRPHNGLELGAMAALLVVAVLFGTDRPPPG